MANNRRILSLPTKLGLAFALIAVLISAFLTIAMYAVAVRWLRESLRNRIRDAVTIAASQLGLLDGGREPPQRKPVPNKSQQAPANRKMFLQILYF